MRKETIRIGCASGFWGDSSLGAPQLVEAGKIDYLVFDYLAELTMSILAGARLKDPNAGYATDFVTVAMQSVLTDVVEKGILVISNAGGINPQACAEALRALGKEQGVDLKIAVVEGDDVLPLFSDLSTSGITEFAHTAPLPKRLLSANAYLGAFPIAAALDAGAQIVITGRCVDSAVTLGALIHAFGWEADEYDLLASGSLAGHLLECGCQATGGLYTDWESVPDWANIGYPIVEAHADGGFVVTKPERTGGLVTPATVGEQLLYEIGNPSTYILPDVICDFRQVHLTQDGEDRVSVTNVHGRAPTNTYKVSATYIDGFKCSAQLTIIGFDAARKAQRTGEALIERNRRLFREHGWEDFTATLIEVLGAESVYGPHGQVANAREVVMHLAVSHTRKEALELFRREVAAPGTSWSPGTTGGAGRPNVSPAIKQLAFLLDKARIKPRVSIDGKMVEIAQPQRLAYSSPAPLVEDGTDIAPATLIGKVVQVPLIVIAHGRSGDKGDTSNIGIIARRREYLAYIAEQVTEKGVSDYLAHLVEGKVTRYHLPGINAFNFVCEQALGGGGSASLRNDALGKGMAQLLLSFPVYVPQSLLPGVLTDENSGRER